MDRSLVRIRHSLRKRRMDAKGTYSEEPDSWITLKSNGEHVPLNSQGMAIGGAGGWAKGKDFSRARSTKKATGKASVPKLVKGAGVSPEYRTSLENVEKGIRSNKTESAYVIEADGNVLFKESQGHKSQVAFTAEQVAKMNGANLTHNHPSGTTFSTEDLNLLVHANLASIRATSDKADYELARMDGEFPESEYFAQDYAYAQAKHKNDVDKEYFPIEKLYMEGLLTKDEFDKECDRLNGKLGEMRDKWLKEKAQKYGFQYTVTRR